MPRVSVSSIAKKYLVQQQQTNNRNIMHNAGILAA